MLFDRLNEKILKVAGEPFEYFDEQLVHRLLTSHPEEYFKFVLNELKDIADGRISIELPPKQIFSEPDNAADFRVMPCVVRGASGVRKTAKIVGTNINQKKVPDQITVGKVFVIDPDENFISHIFEACLLSSARTGLCAAVATELLSVSRNRVTVVGAGRVGYYSALYTASLKGVEELFLFDTDVEKAEHAAKILAEQVTHMKIRAAMPDKTDVLILATTSSKPISKPPGYWANLVISLGADTDFQSELDPAWATASDVFVDTPDSARFGDLLRWQTAGLITAKDITDLIEVLSKSAPAGSRTRIFVSTGSALFDNITVGYLLKKMRPID
ncbi:MAG: hypothetical protein EPN22_15540 [Nitrospirae bacterium]|nr:MAG: hypothetical protein EPN22_15540 [Nitrospirota bacterium]